MTYSATTKRTAPAHILVVDDEPEIAESLAEFLSFKEGYRITLADDGQAAMAILESAAANPAEAIDLVLLDMRMPVMSGPEVLSLIRSHPELRYTRVIVLTAAVGHDEKVEALSSGADDYITKPYQPQELLARVKTILRSRQLEKQLQRQSRQLTTLNQYGRAVTARLATGEVFATAVQAVEAVLDVELASIFMVDSGQSHLYCRHLYPEDGQFKNDTHIPIPIGAGVIGLAFHQKSPLCLNEPSSDSRFQPSLDVPGGKLVESIIAAPLLVRGQPVGVVAGYNRRGGPFSEVDQDLLSSLASSVSRAIEITWLFRSVRQRQQDLLESRNASQAVIDGILHPIYTINQDWRLVAVNETKASELEAPLETPTEKACFSVFFDRQSPCDHCRVASTLEDNAAQQWSVNWLEDDHRPREWDVTAYPIPGSKADSARAVVVWQDRTEERRLERSLVQAAKLASIGQLAAGVAHEINNPLTAINANAQMLQMVTPPEHENYEPVDLIARAGDRAAKVVRGLLDFARQAQFEVEAADINESIRLALNLLSYQFTTANIEIVTDLAEDLPRVDGSREHLQSVWLNLLLNARDALQDSASNRVVEIGSSLDSAGQHILVHVRDTGRGMSSAELAQVFEPFYTTKAPGQGTGLGLATCHQIVEQHGGHIDVTSTPGEGTTFEVRLPVPDAAD